MMRKILLFTITLGYSYFSFSQKLSPIDSLIMKANIVEVKEKAAIYNQIAEKLIKSSSEKAFQYADKAEILAIKTKNSYEQAKAQEIKGAYYLNSYRYAEAIQSSVSALDIFLKIEKLKEAAEVCSQLGLIYKQKLNYNEALANFNKALSYFELVKDSTGLASIYNYLGSLYYNQTLFDKAIEFYNKSMQIRKNNNDKPNIALLYNNLALVYRDQGSFYAALNCLSASLDIYRLINDKQQEANTLNLIGSIYLKMKKTQLALEFYQESLSIREKLGSKTEIANSYNNIGLAYKELNHDDKALECFQKALSIRKEINDKKAIAYSFNIIGGLYWKNKKFSDALTNYLESLKISTELEEKIDIANALTNIGNIYFELENFNKALDYYNEALNINKEIEDINRVSASYNYIGNTWSKLGKYDKAIENHETALKLREKIGNLSLIANSLNNIGNAYSDKGNFNDAIKYYNRALTILKKINDKPGISTTLNNMGNLYNFFNNREKALDYFEKANKKAEECDFEYNIALCDRKIGEILLTQKNYGRAMPFLDQSVQIGSELNNLELLKKGYFAFFNFYESQNDFKKALEYYMLYTNISDSINSSMTNKKLLDMQVGFELSKREGEIKKIENEYLILKKEKQLSDLELKRQQYIRIFLLILSLLLLSIGLLYYNRYQLKHKAANLLQEKLDIIKITNQSLKISEEELRKLNTTKDKFFSILAHDIKNPLSGFIGYTELLMLHFKDIPKNEKMEMLEMLNKSAYQLANLLENLLHWSRSQTGRIPFNPAELKPFDIAEANLELLKANAEKKNIMILNLIDPLIQIKADNEMITLIYRNIISNAIKFTPKDGKITINSLMKDKYVELSVEDTGIGIAKDDIQKLFRIDVQFTNPGTDNESGTGLGLILCKEFVQKHNGKIWVESEVGKGSKFIFTIPIS